MKKGSIFSSLLKNYIFLILMLIFGVIASLILFQQRLDKTLGVADLPNIGLEPPIGINYEEYNITDLDIIGGWFVILNSNLEVIYTKGTVQEEVSKYTLRELLNINKDLADYLSIINSFTDTNGEELISIVKIPSDKVKVNLNVNNLGLDFSNLLFKELFLLLISIALLSLVSIVIFSLFTSKRISKPLKEISKGLEEIMNNNYDEKLNFKGSKEFENLRDTFNYLSDRLDESERNRVRAEESKKRLMAEMAHDIKTPLTSIQGFSQALANGLVEDSKKASYYSSIYKKSTIVNSMIDDLFQWAKLDSTDYSLNLEKKNLSELLRRVVANLYEDIDSKEMDLDLFIEDEFIRYVDEKLIIRAFSNLIINAVKYNPNKTKLHISICKNKCSSRKEDISVEYIVIDICDNGIGIDEVFKDNIFDAFTRCDDSRKNDGGSGLGLAIVKRIVELHKGSIELLSDPNYKTIFKIKLPNA